MRDDSVDKSLESLNQEIDGLRRLQENAHPGLITWDNAVRKRLLEIERKCRKLTGGYFINPLD